MRYLLSIAISLYATTCFAGWGVTMSEIIPTDETFDSSGYDLTWTEVDTISAIDPDSTTRYKGSPGQSLQTSVTGTDTEVYAYYDMGSATATKSVSFYIYLDDYTLPANDDIIYIVSLGNTYSTSTIYTDDIAIGLKLVSGVAQLYCASALSGGNVAASGILDKWVLVEIDYSGSGASTITINGSETTCPEPDSPRAGARYLTFGAIDSLETDESLIMYIDNVDNLD